MFYKILKNFFLKKNVTKRLQNQQPLLEHQKIETIGLLVDETYFSNTASLVEAISSQGFRKEQITKPFDLLINYYDVNKYGILLLSIKSKANFKVGFDTVDKRVNHFIIKELVDNYKEFTSELFKYLKILNKI